MKLIPTAMTLLLSVSSVFSYANNLENNYEGNVIIAQLSESKREVALDLSKQYTRVESLLRNEINQYNLAISAEALMTQPQVNAKALTLGSQSIRAAKGLTAQDSNLVQLRLASKNMLSAWQQGQEPLFAYAPDGDDKQWGSIEAFDVQGNPHYLDVYNMPERPVFIVEVDNKEAMKEGMKLMRDTLAAAQIKSGVSKLSAKNLDVATVANTDSISTSVIKQISLRNDQEPWISGAAEIYAIITGVDPSRKEPMLDTIELPYLDYDGTTYTPDQIAIHWERYRWAAVDMIIMEHDDGTNYKTLVTALLEAATQILRLIPDPQVQTYAVIPQITNGIIKALPDAWFTNNDDFVDAYYTLQEGVTYTNRNGSGVNANMTLAPLTINSRN